MINKNDIKQAVVILKNGGVVVYPTETVYGIGCDPMNADACERVHRIKKRNHAKPMLLLAYSLSQVEEMSGPLSEILLKLAKKFWPGPLTMIIKPQTLLFKEKKKIFEHIIGSSNGLINTHGIAFRVTSHPVAASLIKEFGHPIISTSANITGQSPLITYEEAFSIFRNKVDIVIRTNKQLTGKPSTVVDLTSDSLLMVREGNITLSQLQEAL
ncbi:L-threonylcarbamoyladenylate synthase [Candidatus Latescibacterota bacterium]